MIRECKSADFQRIYEIINDAASAYKGVIPEDRWQDPYMSASYLQHEINSGVVFWGYDDGTGLCGVMGVQDKGEVHLIRHAYVQTRERNKGIGTAILKELEAGITTPILVGTWMTATWAISFYEKNSYTLLHKSQGDELLLKHWDIPERQLEASVVLMKK
ncbi:MAG: GNAT family N-acetyltransferase [Candidatus Thorarchaeota archaeon]